MSSNFGELIKISIFGQSHSEAIGVVMDGLPVGEAISLEKIQEFMKRRGAAGKAYTTPRKEKDEPEILSGLFEGNTCGAPLSAIIRNSNTQSKDYEKIKSIPRPAHADFSAMIKYGGFQDYRGGGHFSGRLTAPLCFAGAVCIEILKGRGVEIGAHIVSVGHIHESLIDSGNVNTAMLQVVKGKEFPVFDDAKGEEMIKAIMQAKEEQDSIGGIIELCVLGLPVGVGEPMFDGVENKLAQIMFGIPALKGIEFGAGFQSARLKGSENNDGFYYDKEGNVKTKTNHHGGILGGITTGMPLIMRVAFKPTPSIAKEQESVLIHKKKSVKLSIKGRHDPCIVPRAVPCVEAAAAIAVLDLLLKTERSK